LDLPPVAVLHAAPTLWHQSRLFLFKPTFVTETACCSTSHFSIDDEHGKACNLHVSQEILNQKALTRLPPDDAVKPQRIPRRQVT
jgi:hypothetical protein